MNTAKNKIHTLILFVLWLLSTVLLTMTIIGIFVFLIEDKNDERCWFNLGKRLLESIVK